MITLATLPKATSQEVFDQVALHLMTQGEPSMVYGACAYDDKEGMKCAAGCLISDEEYDPKFEGRPWNQLVRAGKVPMAHRELIRSLQKIHDTIAPNLWKGDLLVLAEVYRLQLPDCWRG